MMEKRNRDFNIKGANFAGSLKPDKVASRKVHDRVSGITPAGTSKLVAMKSKVPINNNK